MILRIVAIAGELSWGGFSVLTGSLSIGRNVMNNIIPLEYDGHPVRFNNDGWINATDIAAKFGKVPNEWFDYLKQ
nr:hypothetical protein [Providencia heimbachae]